MAGRARGLFGWLQPGWARQSVGLDRRPGGAPARRRAMLAVRGRAGPHSLLPSMDGCRVRADARGVGAVAALSEVCVVCTST